MNKSNAALDLKTTNTGDIQNTPIIYGDLSSYCKEFKAAVDLYNFNSSEKSLHLFQLAYESVNHSDMYHNKYASYCGMARLLNGDRGGLDLCRDAARSEINDADVFLNLARAEWHFQNRKKTIMALEKGLQINNRHPGLLKMREQLGIRKHKPLSIFGRNSSINKFFGKLLRKN